MSVNFLKDARYIRNYSLCRYDSSAGYSTEFKNNGDVDGWDIYHSIHTYGSWDGVLFGSTYEEECYIGRNEVFLSVTADQYYSVEFIMKVVDNNPDRVVKGLKKGKVAWKRSEDAEWSSDRELEFDIDEVGVWKYYKINMGPEVWWQGDINNLRFYPFTDAREGDQFFIKFIRITSVDTWQCTNTQCSYYQQYTHPCPGIGSAGYCEAQTPKKLLTTTSGINSDLTLNIDDYGEETFDLGNHTNIDGVGLSKIIGNVVSTLSTGGYSYVKIYYTDNERFRITSGTVGGGSNVIIPYSKAAVELGFYDDDGTPTFNSSSGTVPATGFDYTSTRQLATYELNRIVDGSMSIAYVHNPTQYSVEGGRRDFNEIGTSSLVSEFNTDDGQISFNNVGKTIVDLSHRIDNNGKLTHFWVYGKLMDGAQVKILRPHNDGGFTVVESIAIYSYISDRVYTTKPIVYRVDLDVLVNKGDLLGVYNVDLFVGQTVDGLPDATFCQYNGDISGRVDKTELYSYGVGGFSLYSRGDLNQSNTVLEIDMGYRLNISELRIFGEERSSFFEFNVASCLDLSWEVDLFGGTHNHSGTYIVSGLGWDATHNNIAYGKECLDDGVLTADNGLQGDSYGSDNGLATFGDHAYFYVNGDSEWIYSNDCGDPAEFCGNTYPTLMGGFDTDPIEFTLTFPNNSRHTIHRSVMYFKEENNFRSFELSHYQGPNYARGNANNNIDYVKIPSYTEISIDGGDHREGENHNLDVYLFENPTKGVFTNAYDTEDVIRFLATKRVDWTILGHTFTPVSCQGFRIYCNKHNSTKMTELELYSRVENDASLVDNATIKFSDYGDVWRSAEFSKIDGGISAFIGGTPRYLVLSFESQAEFFVNEIDVTVTDQVYLDDSVVLLNDARTGKVTQSTPIDIVNTYDKPFDLTVDIPRDFNLMENIIFWNTLSDESDLDDSGIGPKGILYKSDDFTLTTYHGQCANNVPSYGLVNLINGKTAYYRNNSEDWVVYDTLSSGISVDFDNSDYIDTHRHTIDFSPISAKYIKLCCLSPASVFTVKDVLIYNDSERLNIKNIYENVDCDKLALLESDIFSGETLTFSPSSSIGIELFSSDVVNKIILIIYDSSVNITTRLYTSSNNYDFNYYLHEEPITSAEYHFVNFVVDLENRHNIDFIRSYGESDKMIFDVDTNTRFSNSQDLLNAEFNSTKDDCRFLSIDINCSYPKFGENELDYVSYTGPTNIHTWPTPNNGYNGDFFMLDENSLYVTFVDGDDKLYLSKSYNRGLTWYSTMYVGYGDNYMSNLGGSSIWVYDKNNIFICAYGLDKPRFYYTNNGTDWTGVSLDIATSGYQPHIYGASLDNIYLICAGQWSDSYLMFYHITDAGATQTSMHLEDPYDDINHGIKALDMVVYDEDTIFVAADMIRGGGTYYVRSLFFIYSLDKGSTWTWKILHELPTSGFSPISKVQIVVVDKDNIYITRVYDHDYLYSQKRIEFYKTSDMGDTWTGKDILDADSWDYLDCNVMSADIDRIANRFYVSYRNSNTNVFDFIYSDDEGETWTTEATPIVESNLFSRIRVSKHDVLMTSTNGVLRTLPFNIRHVSAGIRNIRDLGIYPDIIQTHCPGGGYNTYWDYLGTFLSDYFTSINIANGADVSATTTYLNGYDPVNTINGINDEHTYIKCWGYEKGTTPVLYIDFGDTYLINKVIMYNGYHPDDLIVLNTAYTFSVSPTVSGTDFVDAFSVTGINNNNKIIHEFEPINARRGRLTINSFTTMKLYVTDESDVLVKKYVGFMREIEVYNYTQTSTVSSEDYPIVCMNLKDSFEVVDQQLLNDVNDPTKDWDNHKSFFNYSDNISDDPQQVSFTPQGDYVTEYYTNDSSGNMKYSWEYVVEDSTFIASGNHYIHWMSYYPENVEEISLSLIGSETVIFYAYNYGAGWRANVHEFFIKESGYFSIIVKQHISSEYNWGVGTVKIYRRQGISKWISVKRDTATNYSWDQDPDNYGEDYLSLIKVYGADRYNIAEYSWWWSSTASTLYNNDTLVVDDESSLYIDYPTSSGVDILSFRPGDTFGVDYDWSIYDVFHFNWWVNDVNKLDTSFGNIVLGGGQEGAGLYYYSWDISNINITSGWNDITLMFNNADTVYPTEGSNYNTVLLDDLNLKNNEIELSNLYIRYKGLGNSFNMTFDGFKIQRNTFESDVKFGKGLCLTGHDSFVIPLSNITIDSGAIEFWVKLGISTIGKDVFGDIYSGTLFTLTNNNNDIIALRIKSANWFEVIAGNIRDQVLFNLETVQSDYHSSIDDVIHIGLSWSNDGSHNDVGDTIRFYINNDLKFSSKDTWDVGDTKLSFLKLGGGITQLNEVYGNFGNFMYNNLKIYNYFKDSFSLEQVSISDEYMYSPETFLQISKDNINFYEIGSDQLPFVYEQVPSGDKVTIYVRSNKDRRFSGDNTTAQILVDWLTTV